MDWENAACDDPAVGNANARPKPAHGAFGHGIFYLATVT